MKPGETVVFDDPGNRCFGCSPHNPRGLGLRFTRTGERSVESRTRVAPDLCGYGGVVHGGVQAALLDEVMGVAAHTAFDPEEVDLVTVEMELRYRRPVPAGRPLVVRAAWTERDGRDVRLEGAIESAEGEALTTARSRWRRIRREPTGR